MKKIKSWRQLKNDPRVASTEWDEDGYWIYLNDPYYFEGETQTIHEETQMEALDAFNTQVELKVENLITRQQVSSRGGGVEIALDKLGFEGHLMSAYQNYLGGGLLGRVCSSCTVPHEDRTDDLKEVQELLKRYFHNITNPDTEWEGSSYEQNQLRPESGF